MQNFTLRIPTKVLAVRGGISAIGEYARQFGTRALLVYGRESIKTNGVYQQVTQSLTDAGIDWTEHGGVRPNPVISHARAGIDKARQHRAEVIVAVGGGSVIDSAKAIAAGAVAGHDVWQFFRGKKTVKAALPLICAATLAGSGSELNGGMVLTNEDTGLKLGFGSAKLYPRVAILDPDTTRSVPARLLACGAVDIVSHLIEIFLNRDEHPARMQERLQGALIRTVMDACNRAMADPSDDEARSELSWSAALSLSGYLQAGLGWIGFPMHMIEHGLSGVRDIPHAIGMGVVMPRWLEEKAVTEPGIVARLCREIFAVKDASADLDHYFSRRGGCRGGFQTRPYTRPYGMAHCLETGRNDDQGPTDARDALQGLHLFKQWLAAVGMPPDLKGYSVPVTAIRHIATSSHEQARTWRLRDYPVEKIEKFIISCL